MKNVRRTKAARGSARGFQRGGEATPDIQAPPRVRRVTELKARTERQADYVAAIETRKMTFGLGPAGVGKTYIAARIAARMLNDRQITKIVLSRPAVEVGVSIGYLPGEMGEKMAPYMASFGRGLEDGFGSGGFEYHLRMGDIEICPLGFMQGLSWDARTMVLLDEAENATPREMKMFLTRFGEGAVGVVNGDITQQQTSGKSGLIDALDTIGHLPEVGVVRFGVVDCVRSGFVKKVIEAYEPQPYDLDDNQSQLPGFITNGSDRR